MRWLLCLLLASCGGGGGSIPNSGATVPNVPVPPVPPTVQPLNVLDYWPFRESRISSGWESVVNGSTYEMRWGDSVEEFHTQENHGETWLMLDAYSTRGTTTRFISWATRTEINRGDGWVDATPSLQMTPYLPVITGAMSVRSWGWIVSNGNTINRWFHYQTITPVPQVFNSCWTKADMTRDVLRQQEAWWDAQQGWTDRGTGDIDPLTREPNGLNMKFAFRNDVAKGAGHLWQGGYNNGQQFCLLF